MEKVIPHKHNGTDADRIEFTDLSILPEDAIADVSGSADGTYSANEQTLINAQTVAINAILEALRNKNILNQ